MLKDESLFLFILGCHFFKGKTYSMICISCDKEHNEKFCPNCGEKSKVKRISFSSMIKDAFSAITEMDKGFLYNLKNLTINPHLFISSYIKGKRKGVYNPISFLLLSVVIYLAVDSFFKVPSIKELTDNSSRIHTAAYKTGKFMSTYLKYFWVLSIIWLATSTKIVFRKYNYAEHLTIASFIIGYATLASIIPLVIFKWQILIYNPVVYIVIFWMIYQLFINKRYKSETFFLSILCLLLFFFQLVLILVGIGLVI